LISFDHINTKWLWWLLRSSFWLCFVLSSANALAWDNLTIIANTSNNASVEFVDQFKSEWQKSNALNLKLNLIAFDQFTPANLPSNTFVVAVGVQAFSSASKLDPKIPVFGMFVPKLAYDKILKESGRTASNLSAIFLDQSISRQVSMLKAVLPNTKSIGVLLGSTSSALGDEIQQVSNKSGLDVHIELVSQGDDLTSKLQHVLMNSSALLAIADPDIYNKDTAATFLLTTYRQQRPVIGFSQAYVKAGAMAAIFSTPKLLAKQAVEQIVQLKDKPNASIPAPLNPQYFSVEVNRQVARSLGVDVADSATITEQILKYERSMP
jgi:ABC-type uncharacterized transport system substrate-binding protein